MKLEGRICQLIPGSFDTSPRPIARNGGYKTRTRALSRSTCYGYYLRCLTLQRFNGHNVAVPVSGGVFERRTKAIAWLVVDLHSCNLVVLSHFPIWFSLCLRGLSMVACADSRASSSTVGLGVYLPFVCVYSACRGRLGSSRGPSYKSLSDTERRGQLRPTLSSPQIRVHALAAAALSLRDVFP